ncbi:Protein phosphatase methylesterase 1 [Operophtera brumata]|uniref:Protein phosphatase methylesterase 1 n=1 Tax=Operophtera brumata TaxID=104452 RepID=A0A0L7LNG5_OPEBR|nr:Protein phosphatase methylesterase 1 [Operophtera brumata]
MSALQKSIMNTKLPPRCPRTSGISKLAPFGASRRKDYTPVPWKQYFEKNVDVETDGGTFRVYLSPEPDHSDRPRIVTLHGGGYSGLSWALFAVSCYLCVIHSDCSGPEWFPENKSGLVIDAGGDDIRGHGETKANDDEDLCADTLVNEIPPLILVGHSMGGAVAVRAAHLPSLEHCLQGIAVIDVVEGSLHPYTQNYVCEESPSPHALADAIAEEGEQPDLFQKPTGDNCGPMKYKWRIDLSKTERHWSGWFKGLSSLFLSVAAPRLLLLASIDGLDRELTVGQMQGKFQMQVLARCGHAVHEDTPGEVARVIASFALRHRLTATTELGEQMHLNTNMPGC